MSRARSDSRPKSGVSEEHFLKANLKGLSKAGSGLYPGKLSPWRILSAVP